MLKFTPQMQKALGRAVLIQDGDVMYITNGKGWLIAVPNPGAWFPPQILDLVREFSNRDGTRLVDWRVLNAKEVDFAKQKFLPHRARKHADITIYTSYEFPAVKVESLRDALEDLTPSLYGDLVNLSDLFAGGEARAIYSTDAKTRKEEKKGFAKEETAESYHFRFDDKLITADGPQFRVFNELGFTVVCPRKSYASHPLPPLGLRWGDGHDIFGYTMPMAGSGVFEDNKGRRLYADAAWASWQPEETSLGELCSPAWYIFKEKKAQFLCDVLDSSWGRDGVRLAVSSLLWKGWSVEAIDDAYEAGRAAAYAEKAHVIQENVRKCIEELESKPHPWRVQNIEHSIKRFCDTYEAMGNTNLGLIPEAIAALGKAQEHGERAALGA